MTAPRPKSTRPKLRERFVLPDPPEREPEDMTSFKHLGENGNVHHLIQHFRDREGAIFGSEKILSPTAEAHPRMRRIPDLLIAFDADQQLYVENNGYIVSEQGKPPDFVLEIASPSTGQEDIGRKRDDYAALGVVEYWRFDETGAYHGTRLAGDRLVDGEYQALPLEVLEDGSLQGYSAALNLFLRWENGQLGWYDPATGRHIVTFDDERARAEQERFRADAAGARAEQERIRAEQEQQARISAEARVRELEAELARQDSEG